MRTTFMTTVAGWAGQRLGLYILEPIARQDVWVNGEPTLIVRGDKNRGALIEN